MRHNFPRDFYLPKSQTLVPFDCGDTDATIYLYDVTGENRGRPFGAIGFHGKANKPDFHYTWKDESRRAFYIADYLKGRKARADVMAKRKAERNAPHPLKVGTILHTSWGYDQTNVEFFEVTRIVGPHTVELRELAQERSETGFMSGRCKPIPGQYLTPRYEGDDSGLPIVRRARGDGSVKICNVRTAWLGGEEKYWSSYA
jgi:hypothetical protein